MIYIRRLAALFMVSFAIHVTASFAADPFNYAALWRSWGEVGQEAYIEGVVDGTFNAYWAAGETWLGQEFNAKPEPDKVRKVREKVFVREQRPQIPAVMTDLYSDPANAYVATLDMVFIARDKLEGKDIARLLQDARKRALDTHRALEREKMN